MSTPIVISTWSCSRKSLPQLWVRGSLRHRQACLKVATGGTGNSACIAGFHQAASKRSTSCWSSASRNTPRSHLGRDGLADPFWDRAVASGYRHRALSISQFMSARGDQQHAAMVAVKARRNAANNPSPPPDARSTVEQVLQSGCWPAVRLYRHVPAVRRCGRHVVAAGQAARHYARSRRWYTAVTATISPTSDPATSDHHAGSARCGANCVPGAAIAPIVDIDIAEIYEPVTCRSWPGTRLGFCEDSGAGRLIEEGVTMDSDYR